MTSIAIRKARLKRKREYAELKVHNRLHPGLRRQGTEIKKRRAKHFAYERKIFFGDVPGIGADLVVQFLCLN